MNNQLVEAAALPLHKSLNLRKAEHKVSVFSLNRFAANISAKALYDHLAKSQSYSGSMSCIGIE